MFFLSMRWHMQDWSHELFGALREAGGTAYSNYAVGYNNVSVPAAHREQDSSWQHARCASPAIMVRFVGQVRVLVVGAANAEQHRGFEHRRASIRAYDVLARAHELAADPGPL